MGAQTYPPFVHDDVVAPVLLGQVWGQDIKAAAELGKHHVVRVTWGDRSPEPGPSASSAPRERCLEDFIK